ncbi:MAG: hypothetical protein OXR84_01800 [Magnetovibrio sp.]|nr:hypothetical protein [Magnetovibrio sp.]
MISWVRLALERSWRTWAAECQVVPQVSCLRSTRTTPSTPALAR